MDDHCMFPNPDKHGICVHSFNFLTPQKLLLIRAILSKPHTREKSVMDNATQTKTMKTESPTLARVCNGPYAA